MINKFEAHKIKAAFDEHIGMVRNSVAYWSADNVREIIDSFIDEPIHPIANGTVRIQLYKDGEWVNMNPDFEDRLYNINKKG